MKKRTNREAFIQFLILILTSFFIIFSLLSGKIKSFVHPRFNISLWISAIILIIFAISVLSEKKKGWHNVNLRQYVIYIIPLFVALIFPPGGTSSSAMILSGSKNPINSSSNVVNFNDNQTSSENKEYANVSEYLQDTEEAQNIQGTQNTEEGQNIQDTQNTEEPQNIQDEQNTQDTQNIQNNTNTQDTQILQDSQNTRKDQNSKASQSAQEATNTSDSSKSYSKKEIDNSYIIEDADFANWYMDLYDHLEDFVGKRYQFLAQVYSMEGLGKNQFLAGRYFMVCCAVDLSGYGIICESELRSELVEDQWVTVTATISKGEYDGSEVPILTDVIINQAEAPEDEYIYYTNY